MTCIELLPWNLSRITRLTFKSVFFLYMQECRINMSRLCVGDFGYCSVQMLEILHVDSVAQQPVGKHYHYCGQRNPVWY